MKKTLVFEPFFGGHYTNYIEALCEYSSQTDELKDQSVIFAVNEQMLKDERISRFRDTVEFDTKICRHRHSPAFSARKIGSYVVEHRKLWADYEALLERHSPFNVIIPSADHLSQASLLARSVHAKPHNSTAFIHQSRGSRVTASGRVKRLAYEGIWALSPWDRILLVNPQSYYERVKPKKNEQHYGLAPDPVARVKMISRREARQKLGLDVDKSYVGVVGSIGVRLNLKAILEAFRVADMGTNTQLVLAGQPATQAHRELINQALSDPKISRSIIFLDRYLKKDELHYWYRACNVVTPYYSDSSGFSANLLLAASANVPAIVANHGFGDWLVRKFPHIGTASSANPSEMAHVMRRLLDASKVNRPPPDSVTKLLEFYSSINFSRVAFGQKSLISPYPSHQPPARSSQPAAS